MKQHTDKISEEKIQHRETAKKPVRQIVEGQIAN